MAFLSPVPVRALLVPFSTTPAFQLARLSSPWDSHLPMGLQHRRSAKLGFHPPNLNSVGGSNSAARHRIPRFPARLGLHLRFQPDLSVGAFRCFICAASPPVPASLRNSNESNADSALPPIPSEPDCWHTPPRPSRTPKACLGADAARASSFGGVLGGSCRTPGFTQ